MSFAPFLAPERDGLLKQGRAKSASETYYIIPGCYLNAASTQGLDANTDTYTAFYVETPLVVDQIAVEVQTLGGTNFRIGFYKADTNWQPIGAPMADSGNLSSGTTGVKTYTPGTPILVPRGRYLSVINADSVTPVFRVYRGAPHQPLNATLGSSCFLTFMEVARALAAFPTPGTAWDTEITTINPQSHFVVYRVLTP